jgi:hypothetical protein
VPNPSPREIPRSQAELIATLQSAMPAPNANTADPAIIDDEQLALLCLGESGHIPAANRRQVLELVASDPQIAALVADLRAAGWGADKRLVDAASIVFRISSWTWAAAACVVVGLGAWRIASPPAAAPSAPMVAIAPNPAPTTPSQQIPTNAANQQQPSQVQGQFIQPPVTPAPAPQPPLTRSAWAQRDIMLMIAFALSILLTPFTYIWARFHRARRYPRF